MTQTIDGLEIAYEVHGTTGPWVTFSHSLGCSRKMWSSQIEALSNTCRVLAYDLRGHGESEADATAGSLALYASDVIALMDGLGIRNSHFVGISVGGMIGQTLALKAPERIASLVLANTTPFMPPAAIPAWLQRIDQAKNKGVASLAAPSLERWFPETFRTGHSDLIASLAKEFANTSVQGYVSCCQAIMTVDTRNELERIACPTLIIAGSQDPGAPAEVLQQLKRIPNSELLVIEGAGHLSNIDHPEQFTTALKSFLDRNASVTAKL